MVSMISQFIPCAVMLGAYQRSELQPPVKSAEVFQHLGCSEAVEFGEENASNESMMDVEYLQKDNSSSIPEHTENKSEMDRRKLDANRYDAVITDRTSKQVLTSSGQESSISGNSEYKLHTEQENLMGFSNQIKEENYIKGYFVSAEICVSSNSGEMLNEKILIGERHETEGVSKSPEVVMIHKTTGKKFSGKAGSGVLTKEECEMQSETNFELTVMKGKVTSKTGKHVLDKHQDLLPRINFESQHKEHCFTGSNSRNTLNSEDGEFQVCGERGDSGVRDAIPLEKVTSSFRELAACKRSEKTKLNLQLMSNAGVSGGGIERNTNKLHRASLGKSYFIAENKILQKSNLNPNGAKSTIQEILLVSSGNTLENRYAAKVSESYQLDFEVSPVQDDLSLGTELLGSAGDLNTNTALSEIISKGEDYFPLSEHGLAKKLLSHNEKGNEKKISQCNIYGLDNISISGNKLSREHRLEQIQKYKDLSLVAERDNRGKGPSTKGPGKNTEVQKISCGKAGKKASLEKKEKRNKRDSDNEEKRSTTYIKVPEFLRNANETINLTMILNQHKSTSESDNMSRSSDLKLIGQNLNNEYTNDILITMHFVILKFFKFL